MRENSTGGRSVRSVCIRPIGLRMLEISFPFNRKPTRCHPTTVSGVTTISACFRPDQHLRAKTQKGLPNAAGLRLGRCRFNAASCWRRTRFSRSCPRRLRKSRRIAPTKSTTAAIMCECYGALPVNGNAVSVEISGEQNFGEGQARNLLDLGRSAWQSRP